MKFNWSFEQSFEYMLTKQPNFYLVPHFVSIAKIVEQFVQLKNQHNFINRRGSQQDLLMNKLDASELDETKRDEVMIWNTFINTRVPHQQSMMKKGGASTWRQGEIGLFDHGNYIPY
jgi:hypothetical protein